MEPIQGTHNGHPYFFAFERVGDDVRWGTVIVGHRQSFHTYVGGLTNAPPLDATCISMIHMQIGEYIEAMDKM